MATNTGKKKHARLVTAIVLVIVIACCGLAAKLAYDNIYQKVSDNVLDSAVSQTSESADGSKVSLSQADREKAKEIISDKVPVSDLPKLYRWYKAGDTSQLASYAKSHFTEDEINELRKLAQ
ncbi:MAG: hypothetical protein ACOX4I_00495 [Anaerovoracaceae bacterium]